MSVIGYLEFARIYVRFSQYNISVCSFFKKNHTKIPNHLRWDAALLLPSEYLETRRHSEMLRDFDILIPTLGSNFRLWFLIKLCILTCCLCMCVIRVPPGYMYQPQTYLAPSGLVQLPAAQLSHAALAAATSQFYEYQSAAAAAATAAAYPGQAAYSNGFDAYPYTSSAGKL